eukprot:13658680-Ditylum_brightwellii.AAC.1
MAIVHVLGVHIDSPNGHRNKEEDVSMMNSIVGCFSIMKSRLQESIIGYGRESVVKAVKRFKKYGPFLQDSIKFYKMTN